MLMTRLVLLGEFGTVMILFAEGATVEANWTNITALGINAVVLIFIVTKMLPSLQGKFIDQAQIYSETIKTITKESTAAIAVMHTENAAILDKIHSRSEAWELARHADFMALSETLRGLAIQCGRRGAERQHELEDRLKKEEGK